MQNVVSINNFVNSSLTITATAAPYANFSLPLILGDASVIDVTERYRTYSSLSQVAQDFGTALPEYLAAQVFFSQSPQPASCMIGKWARTATAGLLKGASFQPIGQAALLAALKLITTGSLKLTIDGTGHDVTGLNFAAILNLNGAAAILQTAIRSAFSGALITVLYDSVYGRFVIASATTGTSSTVAYAQAAASGVDVSATLGLTAATGASPPVAGIAAETALAAWAALATASSQWYFGGFAAGTMPSTSDYLAVAGFVAADSRRRMLGVTIITTDCYDSTNTTDLASQLQALNIDRVYWWYDPANPYGVFTMAGRAATVRFNASESTITLAYKQAPGLTAAYLTESQFATIQAKGGNCNVAINNGAVIIWPGQMADSKWSNGAKINGTWFDERHNCDWFLNEIQTDGWNLLYTTTTKIPQTDPGSNIIATIMEGSCAKTAVNGMAAPGKWTGPNIGSLRTGDTLAKGWYVYYPAISTQSDADRDSRVSVPFQIAIKLAGAVHTVDLAITVNR